MANLIIGDGQSRSAQNDADIFAEIYGDDLTILDYGEQFAYNTPDDNTVRVYDGLLMIEGRGVQIKKGLYEDFEIPTGHSASSSTYYLGWRIFTDDSGAQDIEQVVSEEQTETGSLRDGDESMYVWLYKVSQVGLEIASVTMIPSASDFSVPSLVKVLGKTTQATFSNVEIPSGKWTMLGYLQIDDDYRYTIDGMAMFDKNSTGDRDVFLSNSDSVPTATSLGAHSSPACSGQVTTLTAHDVMQTAAIRTSATYVADQCIYLYVYQNSGSTLKTQGKIKATIMGARK